MKRRLDLALALVHRPRDPLPRRADDRPRLQSRTALWDEVARLAADDGVTVFLTTQYLEEADVLADRVGIIDHGRIVAEGTPAELKAEIGRPDRRGDPGRPGRPRRGARRCSRASASARAPRGTARPCASTAAPTSPRSCARSTPRTSRSRNLQLHAPTLDDVFLAKTGRSLEGAGDDADERAGDASAERGARRTA